MWFGVVRIDIESSDIASDEVQSRFGFLWDVDAQIKCGLQKVLVDLVLGLVESKNHHTIRLIVILLVRGSVGVLHIRDGALFRGSHCKYLKQYRLGFW